MSDPFNPETFECSMYVHPDGKDTWVEVNNTHDSDGAKIGTAIAIRSEDYAALLARAADAEAQRDEAANGLRRVLAYMNSRGHNIFPQEHRDRVEGIIARLPAVTASETQRKAREALAPFVDFPSDAFEGDDDCSYTITMTIGDMKRAREALAPLGGE